MTADESDETNKSNLQGSGQQLPAHRTGDDADMASVIIYLASRSTQYTNGQLLYPDGGEQLLLPCSRNLTC